MEDEAEAEEDFFQGRDFQVKENPPKGADLSQIVEEQKRQIADLQEKLREKDRQLQSLSSVLSQQSSPVPPSPEKRTNPSVFSPPKPQAISKASVSGSEFWDSHLENNEGNDYSFEDIAAKGLWILNSAAERKQPVVTQTQGLMRATDAKKALPPKVVKHPAQLPASPQKQSLPSVSKPPLKAQPVYGSDSPPPQLRPSRMPPVPVMQSPSKSRAVQISASPPKTKSLPQPIEIPKAKEAEFPLAQGYLRMRLKQGMEKAVKSNAAEKLVLNANYRKRLNPAQLSPSPQPVDVKMHRKVQSLALSKGKKCRKAAFLVLAIAL